MCGFNFKSDKIGWVSAEPKLAGKVEKNRLSQKTLFLLRNTDSIRIFVTVEADRGGNSNVSFFCAL